MSQRHQSAADHDHIHYQINSDDRDSDADDFPDALQEQSPQQHDHSQSDPHLTVQPGRRVLKERVLDQVLCCIRGRQRDRDDKIGRGESKER